MPTLIITIRSSITITIILFPLISPHRQELIKEHAKKADTPLPGWVRALDAPGNACEHAADTLDEKLEVWVGGWVYSGVGLGSRDVCTDAHAFVCTSMRTHVHMYCHKHHQLNTPEHTRSTLQAVWFKITKPFRKGHKNLERPLSQAQMQTEMAVRLSMRDMSGHIPDDVLNAPEVGVLVAFVAPIVPPVHNIHHDAPLSHHQPQTNTRTHTHTQPVATTSHLEHKTPLPTTLEEGEVEEHVHRKAQGLIRYSVF